MNFLSPLIDWHFWLDLTPTRMAAGFEAAFFALFALTIIGGSIIRMVVRNRAYDKYRAEMLKRAASIATWFGVVGFVWFFFTFEEIQFFGSRFWFLVLVAVTGFSVWKLWRYGKKDVPELQHREQSRAEVNKYLPRRSL